MDAKVKAMIKLIEEDADSFARRAEMYYKKRPELMKLVEEFYRAYRALAERYNHATGELRQAHRTMAEAFPNQEHFLLNDDSPCSSSGEPHTPEMPQPIRTFLDQVEGQKDALGLSRKGLKQLNEIFGFSPAEKQANAKVQNNSESDSEHAGRAEIELEALRKTLADVQLDKDSILLQYQKSLESLSELEKELNKARNVSEGLDEQAIKAEIEIGIWKEALAEVKSKKDTGLVQYDRCLERIASLEAMLSSAQLEAKGHDERAAKAETEAKSLKEELARLEAEKDAGRLQYEKSLEKISVLESKINLAEENSRMLTEKIERAEVEVKALKEKVTELNEEKEAVALMYKQCLEKLSSMESEILHAHETSERLNREIKLGAEKLKTAEKNCDTLEKSNRSLQLEADNLVQKISIKDRELLEKHNEFERMQTLMQEEHSRFLQIESTLHSLQKSYSQSQDEQRSLALELKHGLQLLEDLEHSKKGFKEEMQHIVEENKTLHVLNLAATGTVKDQQMEISKLKEIKENLEREFVVKVEESNYLLHESRQIKDEIHGLNNRYRAILEDLESVGLNPKCFAASVMDLQKENLKLKEVCKVEQDEKEALREKSKDMDKVLNEKAVVQCSLSSLNDEVNGLRDTVKKFQESCHVLKEEKSGLVGEKSALLSQLQIITESMQKLMEKNALLESSLSDSKIELEGLRAKSSSLEEFCNLLNNEKSNLVKERTVLVSQLESVEEKLSNLEKRFTKLEEKYSYMEKDKESKANQVEELHALLSAQKAKHANHKHSSESRLANLENLVLGLQEERQMGKVEFEQELDKAVNAQVEMFILQKCMEDLEQKNMGLLFECQKHVEASKFSEKVISELEGENLMQQMEVEFLLEEIRKFKIGIHQVFGALQVDPDRRHNKGFKQEEISVSHILNNIEGLKGSLVKTQEEKLQLFVENSVLVTVLSQQESEGKELDSRKMTLEQELENTSEWNVMLQEVKLELLEMNEQLRSELTEGEERENALKSEMEALCMKLVDLQKTNLMFQDENRKVLEEKNSLIKSVSELKDAKSAVEDENSAMFVEALNLKSLSLVYESFFIEKVLEQKELSEHLSDLHSMNNNLKQELGLLREQFESKEWENVYLKEILEAMDKDLREAKNANDDLSHQVQSSENLLMKKKTELLEKEEKLKAVEMLNAEFCRNVENLKTEQQESRLINENLGKQILELLEGCMNHKKEIELLNEANRSVLSEMRLLHREVEQQKAREKTLSSELMDKTNEFQLWEAEAATFYFDLQISSISEALLENKVNELTGVCTRLQDESAEKSLEIEKMTERVGFLESEVGGLKGHLSTYAPVIRSLEEDFASLEHTVFLTNKVSVVCKQEQKVAVENIDPGVTENKIPDGVSDLVGLKARIRAVERRVKEENLTSKANSVKDYRKVEKLLKDENMFDLNTWRTKSENGSLMKDIPLDQISDNPASKNRRRKNNSGTDDGMLELWETAEHDCFNDGSMVREAMKRNSDPTEDIITCHESDNNSGKCLNTSSELEAEKELVVDKLHMMKSIKDRTQDGKRRKLLERLASDKQKLNVLKMTVQDFRTKMETKKRGSKKGDDTEYETVKRQIEELDGAVVKLADTNDQLTKEIKESVPSSSRETSVELEKSRQNHRKRVMEQARKGSEEIGRLQLEVQNMHCVLLKLSDEKKNTGKKNKFSGKTVVFLRDFIHIGKKSSSKKHNKGCFCGSTKTSTNED
ncbi:hypothetical protein RYX36_020940 [Vicia faba]